MRLFRKKKPEIQESYYEIFGGVVIKKTDAGYEISWKTAHPMSVSVQSVPEIDSNVKTEREGEDIRITSWQCKLKIVSRDGEMKAFISEL
ncbi:MAG: hypothetical protein ACE5NN_06610 [Candidatus Bathyarchaeia archaeon]